MPTPKLEKWQIRVTSPDMQCEGALQFLQGMMDRTGVSYHKYGSIDKAFPGRRTGVENIAQRVQQYIDTKNTEFLMDAANYALIEFLRPSVEGAFFKSTDSDESPGALNRDGSVSHGKG